MRFLYTIGIYIYRFGIFVHSWFFTKSALRISGLKEQTLHPPVIPDHKKVYWFHCASLGEFEQGRPLIENLKTAFPESFILLTFFSASGYEQVKKKFGGADLILYLPYDTPAAAAEFVDMARPAAVFFIKYEFWYNFLHALGRRKYPVYLVSGVFRKNHIFFRAHGKWFLRHLHFFHHFFVQHDESRRLLEIAGFRNVSVTGDTRFDRVLQIAARKPTDLVIPAFKEQHLLLIAGSTWPEDELVLKGLIDLAESNRLPLKMIVFPHEVNEKRVNDLLTLFKGYQPVLWSAGINSSSRMMIADVTGLLSEAYRSADFAYIGGGFGKGVHNTLEAAVYGLPLAFGPEHEKFKEALDLKLLGGAVSILAARPLYEWIRNMVDSGSAKETGALNARYVNAHAGATQKIMEYLRLQIC